MSQDEALREALAQRVRAAEALLAAGHRAEGARLAHDALHALRAASEARVSVEATAANASAPPLSEREIAPADIARAEAQLVSLRAALAAGEGARSPLSRRRRVAVAAIAVLVSLLALAWHHASRPALEARATGAWHGLPVFDASAAIDGDPSTSWLLPDATEGALELTFRAPRAVAHVHLLNTHNPPYEDRGTDTFVVELLGDDGRVRAAAEGRLPWGRAIDWQDVAISASDVAAVRLRVRRWHGAGGGLTEVRVE